MVCSHSKPHFPGGVLAAESISEAALSELPLPELPVLMAVLAAFFAACAAVPEEEPEAPAAPAAGAAGAAGAAAPAVAIIAPPTMAVFTALPIMEAINPAGEPGVPLRKSFM